MANVNEQPLHWEHREAMWEGRLEKYRRAINKNRSMKIETIADVIALSALLQAMFDQMDEAGIQPNTLKEFMTPLEGFFN